MDALSDVLRAVRLSSAIYFDVRASGPWAAETPEGKQIVRAMFPGSEHLICYHVITSGSCWAVIPGESDIPLAAGDVLLLPHGDGHTLASDPALRRSPDLNMYRVPEDGRLPRTLTIGDSADTSTEFVCGFLGCDARPYNPLLSALPRVIRVSDGPGGMLSAHLRFALQELGAARLGAQCVLSHLSELMFVDVVRRYLESLPPGSANWLAAQREPFVGRALTALHRQPDRDWTIETLAQHVGLSRSALAERFTQLVGHPPMQYLTQWRIQLAAGHLRAGTESIATIADRIGYQSEAAFSRAFKKIVGLPPAAWRRKTA